MRKAGCVLARILLATHFFMRSTTGLVCRMKAPLHDVVLSSTPLLSRRSALLAAGCSFLASPTLALDRAEPASAAPPGQALGASKMPMPGLSEAQSSSYGKARMTYPDFKACESGLQVKDVKEGVGDPARVGDRVVISWEGYTIGYYGRPYEKKNSVKGGAFDADQDYFRFVIGKGTAIPGLEEGLTGMRAGGIRQIIVPPELGYPESDRSHDRVGPKPATFSGQRALDFVLFNQGMIDKTLLVNVELKRIDRPGEKSFKG